MKLVIGGKTYYTQTIFGFQATSIQVHQQFNNGKGTSSTIEFREITVYDGSGNDVTAKFNLSENPRNNGKGGVRAGTFYNNMSTTRPFYRFLVDKNNNTGFQGYVRTANDGQASYTLNMSSSVPVAVGKIEIRFGTYNDSSGHDGHQTYVNVNGKRLWTTRHQRGYLRVILSYVKNSSGVFVWDIKTYGN